MKAYKRLVRSQPDLSPDAEGHHRVSAAFRLQVGTPYAGLSDLVSNKRCITLSGLRILVFGKYNYLLHVID